MAFQESLARVLTSCVSTLCPALSVLHLSTNRSDLEGAQGLGGVLPEGLGGVLPHHRRHCGKRRDLNYIIRRLRYGTIRVSLSLDGDVPLLFRDLHLPLLSPNPQRPQEARHTCWGAAAPAVATSRVPLAAHIQQH